MRFEALIGDARLGARRLAASPAFALTVAITLGLAVGASTVLGPDPFLPEVRPLLARSGQGVAAVA